MLSTTTYTKQARSNNMENDILQTRWEQVKEWLLGRWGELLKGKDLPQGAEFEELCQFVSGSCDLPIDTARREVRDALNTIGNQQ
jgi:hypothetical protein